MKKNRTIILGIVAGAMLLVIGIVIGTIISTGTSQPEKTLAPKKAVVTVPTTVKCNVPGIPNSTLPLIGVLEIPSLSMIGPVTDGVSDPVIAVAIGHNPATPWPNQPGTSELSAHDVAQFWDLNQLKPGALVDFFVPCQTETILKVTGSSVVTTNTTVYDLPYTGTILETCWPVNTLAYTNTRLLVDTQVVKTVPYTQQLTVPNFGVAPSVNVPPQLAALGLSLTSNTQPMGEMLTSGNLNPTMLQTNAPMNDEASALEIWFGMLDSIRLSRADWFADISKNVPYPTQLNSQAVTGHYKAMEVTIAGSGNNVTSMTMTAELGFNSGIYDVTATVSSFTQTVSGSPMQYFYLTNLTLNKIG